MVANEQQQRMRLLRLLLGDVQARLHTHAHWYDALLEEHLIDGDKKKQPVPPRSSTAPAADALQPRLLQAIDAIVPHLPDFSSVSPRVEALFGYCRQDHTAHFDRLLRTWLQRRDLPLPFRTWLLQWLHATGVVTASDARTQTTAACHDDGDQYDNARTNNSALQLWHSTLSAALFTEDQSALRQTLTCLLHELAPLESPPVDTISDSDTLETADSFGCSVEELLDMYLANAHVIVPFSLLCAAKLHALAYRPRDSQLPPPVRSSPQPLALTASVVVRLRWGKLLAPTLFDALLRHCAALHVFAPDTSVGDALDTHAFVQQLVRDPHWAEYSKQQRKRIAAIEDQLRRACAANVAHVIVTQLPHTAPQHQQSCSAAFTSLQLAHQHVVLLELERDLEDAPATLLPHVLVAFSAVVRALLAVSAETSSLQHESSTAVLHAAIRLLFALVTMRDDAASCFVLTAGVMELCALLQQPHASIWRRAPQLLVEIVTDLNEQLAVEARAAKRWLLRLLLQHLLFESDTIAVAQCLSALAASLPPRLVRLARLRCHQS